jgi:5-methylcytosine-specific restriction endonuclease McrBC regulatory subunit McrC
MLNYITKIYLCQYVSDRTLVFPKELGLYNDDIEKKPIFNLYDNKLVTYNLMGFIGRKQTQMKISSRFAKEEGRDYFLHYMLKKVLSFNMLNLDTTKDNEGIEDFLPYLFPGYLKRAMQQGLFKQYHYKDYNDINVKGIINITRHINQNVPFKGNIAYRTREYSYDNNMTELIRHTIEHLKTSFIGNTSLTIDPDTRSTVEKIIQNTPLYNKKNRRRIININQKPIRHPYFTEYLPLQRLCLQILGYEKMSFGKDKEKIHGLLFDGAWLWEEYLNTILKGIFKHPRNKTKEGIQHLFLDGKRKLQEIYPDFIGKKENVIADAKYKHLENTNEEYGRNDYYQMITYMYRFKADHGFLIFPYPEKGIQKHYEIINTNGKLSKIGLAIPQKVDNFKIFNKIMINNEKMIIKVLKDCLSNEINSI